MLRRLGLARSGAACFLLLTVLLTACEIPGRPTEICAAGETPLFRIAYPPLFSVIDDLTPTITWTSEDASCMPPHFDIQVWSVNNYLPGASAGYLVVAGAPTDEFIWPSDGPTLEPGNTYRVAFEYPIMRDGEEVGSTSQGSYFSTGPTCSASDLVTAPNLRWPPDNWRVDPSHIELEWDNTMNCFPSDGYYIEISKWEDFRDPIIQTGYYRQGEIFWPRSDTLWENCTRYYWHVHADNEDMEGELWSESWSFVTQPGDMFCPPDLGRPEIPSDTLIPPIARLLADVNCRSGPTMDYPVLDILPAGAQLPIQGRNGDGDSWLVQDANINGTCWVYGDMVEVIGDTSLVMVIDPDPPFMVLPTDTPQFNCAQYTNSNTCLMNNHPCIWQSNACVNK